MRALWLLSIFLLAGCLGAPEDEKAPEPELWGTCPQWITEGNATALSIPVNGTGSGIVDVNMTQVGGYPLDMYVVEVTSSSKMTLRFFAGSQQLQVNIPDAATAYRPSLPVTAGTIEVQIFLTPVEHGTAPAPSPLTVRAEGTGQLDLVAQPWFRVCGVPL